MWKLLKKAPSRFGKSFGYCWDGLKDVFLREESFRLETIAFVALLAVMLPSPWPAWKKTAMIACYLFIPLTEIVNSAVENLCDHVTSDFAPLVKCAKDKGALAVLFAIVFNAFALATLLLV